MFLDTDLKSLTKTQLEERLKDLRSQRELRYKPARKTISTKELVVSSLKGIDSDTAAKILEEITAMLEKDSQETLQ